MLDAVKKRLEIYGIIAVTAGGVIASILGFKGDLALVKQELQSAKDLTQQAGTSSAQLLEAKLDPIAQTNAELKVQLNVMKADVDAIEIATTRGAEARDRMLGGKIAQLQETMLGVQDQQGMFVSRMDTIQIQVMLIQQELGKEPDTLIVNTTTIDTVTVRQKHGLFRRLLPW